MSIRKAYYVALERPPLRRGAIAVALSRCDWMNDRLTMSWRYYFHHSQGGWNRFGPPLEWMIEVLQHVNRYIRENQTRS